MSVTSDKKMVKCSFCPGQGRWITLHRHPIFLHDGPCRSDVRALARSACRNSYASFTHPTTCPVCGGSCFFYQNHYGSKVFFDSLGPPWPKHGCTSSDRKPAQPLAWREEGYEPIHVLDAIPDTKHQALTLQFLVLRSGKHHALVLRQRKDIPLVRRLMDHPFFVKWDGSAWILSTFDDSHGSVCPVTFSCDEVAYQGNLFSIAGISD
jgi:hypothetical protein